MNRLLAEHVIGLLPAEYVNPAESTESVRARFHAIMSSGVLVPAQKREFMGASNSFDLDFLAEDNQYVFLSAGARYRDERPGCVCYGFVFDPVDLINNHGAIVGPDLANAYDDLLDEVVRQVESTLPALPAISDDELAAFTELMGITDSVMIEHIRAESTSRYHDLIAAVEDGDLSVDGAAEAVALFKEGAALIQSETRKTGRDALDALAEGMEILIPKSLPISAAIGTIEAGEIKLFPPECVPIQKTMHCEPR